MIVEDRMIRPPIVGVLAFSFVSSLRAAWWNSGRSPIFIRMSQRMILGPISSEIARLVSVATTARNRTY
jgi:hypothetical protein